jgi:hypothetical protein
MSSTNSSTGRSTENRAKSRRALPVLTDNEQRELAAIKLFMQYGKQYEFYLQDASAGDGRRMRVYVFGSDSGAVLRGRIHVYLATKEGKVQYSAVYDTDGNTTPLLFEQISSNVKAHVDNLGVLRGMLTRLQFLVYTPFVMKALGMSE